MKRAIKVVTINTLLLTTLCMAETPFDLEKEKFELSNKVFNHYDVNKNKILSFKEFATFSKEMKVKEQEKRMERTINSCDKNKNGKIELSEVPTQKEIMEAFKEGKRRTNMCEMDSQRFKHIDKNEDNHITKKELIASYSKDRSSMWGGRKVVVNEKLDELKMFKERLVECDKNEDRELTLMEATAIGCFMTAEEFLTYSADPEKSFNIDAVKEAPRHDDEMNIEYRFKECDANKDNKLTLVEATSRACRLSSNQFTKLDTDSNKYLIINEMKKMYAQNEESSKVPFKVFKNMPPFVQVSMAFHQCDEDKDKKLTKDEAEDCKLPIDTFEKFDIDKSNTIEMNDMKMMQVVNMFDMADINKDKKIDQKEFAERMGNRYRVF